MGFLDRLKSGPPQGQLSPALEALVPPTDGKLRESVLRNEQAILSTLNDDERVTFVGRATGSDGNAAPASSTIFVTTLRMGIAHRGKVIDAFPIKQITRAACSYEPRPGLYRAAVMAERLGTGHMIDFEDQATQLAFMRAAGYEPA
jgi:hypothetical protein